MLHDSVVETNDITASYTEQVEMFQKTLKAALGSIPSDVLEVR